MKNAVSITVCLAYCSNCIAGGVPSWLALCDTLYASCSLADTPACGDSFRYWTTSSGRFVVGYAFREETALTDLIFASADPSDGWRVRSVPVFGLPENAARLSPAVAPSDRRRCDKSDAEAVPPVSTLLAQFQRLESAGRNFALQFAIADGNTTAAAYRLEDGTGILVRNDGLVIQNLLLASAEQRIRESLVTDFALILRSNSKSDLVLGDRGIIEKVSNADFVFQPFSSWSTVSEQKVIRVSVSRLSKWISYELRPLSRSAPTLTVEDVMAAIVDSDPDRKRGIRQDPIVLLVSELVSEL